jgi:hypothetical protein
LFGVGPRPGPGASGPQAQPPARPHVAQTRQSAAAQSPAVYLNGLLVFSRKLFTRLPAGEVEGRGSWSLPGPEPLPPTPASLGHTTLRAGFPLTSCRRYFHAPACPPKWPQTLIFPWFPLTSGRFQKLSLFFSISASVRRAPGHSLQLLLPSSVF